MNRTELKKILKEASAAVHKAYGNYVPSRAADEDLVPVSIWASTGSLALDRAVAGVCPGGLPLGPIRGRTMHIFGDPSLGKSLLLDQIMCSVQKKGGICLVSETEGSRDPHFAKAIGLDLSFGVEIQRPATVGAMADAGLRYIETIRKYNHEVPILWGWDSLTLTQADKTHGIEMSGKKKGAFAFGGGKAQEIGQACSKIAEEVGRYPTSFLVLNQVRENPAVMFGRKKTPTGGKSVPFLASVEIELRSSPMGWITDARKRRVGKWVHAIVCKNKVAPPFAECDFLIHFYKGVMPWHGVFETLEKEMVIKIKRQKREKGDRRIGKIMEKEFTVTKTGEVLPLEQFAPWCLREKILQTPWKPFEEGKGSSQENEENEEDEGAGESEDEA